MITSKSLQSITINNNLKLALIILLLFFQQGFGPCRGQNPGRQPWKVPAIKILNFMDIVFWLISLKLSAIIARWYQYYILDTQKGIWNSLPHLVHELCVIWTPPFINMKSFKFVCCLFLIRDKTKKVSIC